MKRQIPLISILMLVVVALGGCGSSSSTSSDGSKSSAGSSASDERSLTKAEFIVEADALCEASKAKQESLRTNLQQLAQNVRRQERETGTFSDGARKELAEALDRVAAIAETGLSGVQSLGSPKADASQLETIFRKTESALAASRAYAAAVENHEDAKAKAATEKGDADTRDVGGLAKQYGFKVCFSAP